MRGVEYHQFEMENKALFQLPIHEITKTNLPVMLYAAQVLSEGETGK